MVTHNIPVPGFPPKPGEITARLVVATERTMPPVMKNVPMFIYSPANRFGVFYLAQVNATPLNPLCIPIPGKQPVPANSVKQVYSFEAVCMGPMPQAASFSYDPYTKEFVVFYGSARGLGLPGK